MTSSPEVADGDGAPPIPRVSIVLVVVATVLAVVSVVTTWVRTQALDTEVWVATSSELLDEPQVTDALSRFLTDQLFFQVDVAAELEDLLPGPLAGLAAPLVGALREPATNAVDRVIESDRFATLWVEANRRSHTALVTVLREESTAAVSTDDGTIVLALRPALVMVGEELGVPDRALELIPADAGEVVLVDSDALAAAQTTVQVLDTLSWFLFLLVVALYAVAVYLARGRRPFVLGSVGAALVVGGVTVLGLRAVAIREGVDLLVGNPRNEPVASLVVDVGTSVVAQLAATGIVYGLLVLGVAALLGGHRWAVAVRRRLATWAGAPGAVAAVAAAVVVVVVWWSPGRSFDGWVTATTLVVLAVGAVVALAVTVRREFPAA
jgi:hypothetical protein